MRKPSAAVVLAVMVIAAAGTTPSNGRSNTGTLAFQCTMQLPEFPTSGHRGTCDFGLTTGSLAGVTDFDLDPFVLTGLGSFRAEFDYAEACLLNEPPVVGFATGVATATTFVAAVGITPTAATVTIPFSWIRVGLTILILTGSVDRGPTTITFGTGDTASDVLGGVGVAAFTPFLTPSNFCGAGAPLTGFLEGAVLAII